MTCLQEKSYSLQSISSFKKLVSSHFSIAANSYDKYATFQHTVAKNLHQLVASNLEENIALIADLGCGTGRETHLLANRYKQAKIIGIDIATKMLQKASSISNTNIQWCRADIEELPLKPNCINLLFSNLALQWCNLDTVLHNAYSVLSSGGFFIFSTLCSGSLAELKNAWYSVSKIIRVNNYFSVEQLSEIIGNSSFIIENIMHNKYTSFYPNVISLLQSLKYQGVNTIYNTTGKLTSRTELKKLIQSYNSLQSSQGIPLSYQVATIILKKNI